MTSGLDGDHADSRAGPHGAMTDEELEAEAVEIAVEAGVERAAAAATTIPRRGAGAGWDRPHASDEQAVFNFEEELRSGQFSSPMVASATCSPTLTGLGSSSLPALARRGTSSAQGSDSRSYWNVFHFKEEATQPAVLVTYGTLGDMLADTNRIGQFIPRRLRGRAQHPRLGASELAPAPIPIPASVLLLGTSLCVLTLSHRQSWRRNENS